MNSEQSISLEDAFIQLEDIINQLEQGDVPLDQLIQRYEEGIQLIVECRRQLQSAEKRVQVLNQQIDGTFTLQSFEEE